jgi:hypothetical protein
MFQKTNSLYKKMILLFQNALSLFKESAFVVQEMLENVTNARLRAGWSNLNALPHTKEIHLQMVAGNDETRHA